MTSGGSALTWLRALRSREDVAALFGTSVKRFDLHVYVRPKRYNSFTIAKRGGGTRLIEVPPQPILYWQSILADLLRDSYQRKKPAYGFCLGGGVVRNAKQHLRQQMVLNLDLSNFFHSITYARVYGVFGGYPFELPPTPRAMLARLCVTGGRLPQGAPTSPILTNYVCRALDTQLSKLARSTKCIYTRYADDITFSSRRPSLNPALLAASGTVPQLGEELERAIAAQGFTINPTKVWVRSKRERQEVTGILVNEKLNTKRAFVRQLRATLHLWSAQPNFVTAQQEFVRKRAAAGYPPKALDQHVAGKLAFMADVRGDGDALTARYSLEYAQLLRRDGLKDLSIELSGDAALKHGFLELAIVLLEIRDPSGNASDYGTAFWLRGWGLVTNHHVVKDVLAKPGGTVFAAPASSPSSWTSCNVKSFSKHHDLAILDTAIKPVAELRRSGRDPMQGDEIVLAGFPSYSVGAKWRVQPGHVTQLKIQSMVRYVQISAQINPGNSGGPVLDAHGQVVAVARQDSTNPMLPNAAIDIRHLDQLTP